MQRKIRVTSVVGTRPNFMKVAPLERVFRERGFVDHQLVHTGQHYDERMSAAFQRDLQLPEPDHHLGVGSGSHAQQTAAILVAFEALLTAWRPDLVLVVGDVNSTLACALAAAKVGVPVAHVEAGLRSFDRTMPEEINRILTDRLSDLLFVTEDAGVEHLETEGFRADQIFNVGDTMIDTLRSLLPHARERDRVLDGDYAVLTLHRPANVDDRERLASFLDVMGRLTDRIPVLFPIHPRTRKRVEEFGLAEQLGASGLDLIEPQGYLDFLALLDRSRLVLTDSGGIPEELTYLGIPCVTLRTTTERPFTVSHGTNRLVGADPEAILSAADAILSNPARRAEPPPGWDGHAADRISDVIADWAA